MKEMKWHHGSTQLLTESITLIVLILILQTQVLMNKHFPTSITGRKITLNQEGFSRPLLTMNSTINQKLNIIWVSYWRALAKFYLLSTARPTLNISLWNYFSKSQMKALILIIYRVVPESILWSVGTYRPKKWWAIQVKIFRQWHQTR